MQNAVKPREPHVGLNKKSYTGENCFSWGCFIEGMGGLMREERASFSFGILIVRFTIFVA